ncbi:hypothetical protein CMUST_05750 [Corynebacterium mustelae]|uniref:SWIM-type domain-containing protein n=1 Tax=Corynebacterium mustelae TaxID=571915 RepID=A0A0G3GWC7_9CORY|nr:hypothetical protein [Corynebacterium mustelae]AKK05486.1 hypothetical protein CMUST_05750 [Corynebacterium mustelae]
MAITFDLSHVVDQRFALYRTISGKPKFRTALSLAALNCVTVTSSSFADIGTAIIGRFGPFTRIDAEVFDPRTETTTTVCVFPCHDVSLNSCQQCTFDKSCEHIIAALLAVTCEETNTDPAELLETFGMTIPTTWPKNDRGNNFPIADETTVIDTLSFDDETVADDPVSQFLDSFPHSKLRLLVDQAAHEIPEFARWLEERSTIALGSDADIAAMLNTKVKDFKALIKSSFSNEEKLTVDLGELLCMIEEHINVGRGKAVAKQARTLLEILDSAYKPEALNPHMQRLISLYIRLCQDTNVRPINLAKWLVKQQLANATRTQLHISEFLPLFDDPAITHYENTLHAALTDTDNPHQYFNHATPAFLLLVALKEAQGDWQTALELLLAEDEGTKALELVFTAPVSLEQQTQWLTTIKNHADASPLKTSCGSASHDIFYNLVETNQLAAAKMYLCTYYAISPTAECFFNLMVLNEIQSGALTDELHTLLTNTSGYFGMQSGLHHAIYSHHQAETFNELMANPENYGFDPDTWKRELSWLAIINPGLAAEIAVQQAWRNLENTGEAAYYNAAKVLSRVLTAAEFHCQKPRQETKNYIKKAIKDMETRYSTRRRMREIFNETFATFGL